MNESYYLSYEVMRARQNELLRWAEMERKALAARREGRRASKRNARPDGGPVVRTLASDAREQAAMAPCPGEEPCCEGRDTRRSA